MDTEQFGRLIQEARARAEKLSRSDADSDPIMQQKALLAELSTAFEDLRVAEEETRQHVEELEIVQESLATERRNYQDLFDFAPDGYLVTDTHGIIQQANQTFAGLVGRTMGHLTGKPLASYLVPAARRSLREALIALEQGEASRAGAYREWETGLLVRNGETIPVSLRVARASDNQSRQVMLRWAVRDQREHYQLQESRRESQREREARLAAEIAAGRIHRLQTVTAGLMQSATPDEVAAAVIEQGLTAFGAPAGVMALRTEDGAGLEIVRAVGYPLETLDSWRQFPLDTPVPLAEAARTGEPVWISSPEEMEARYPMLASTPRISRSYASIPLPGRERLLGALGVSFTERREFRADERDYLLLLGRLTAQALERARLYESAQREIATREQKERELDEAYSLLDTFIAGAPLGFCVFDREMRYRLINPTLAEMNGAPVERHLGRTLEELIPDVAAQGRSLFHQVMETGQPIIAHEITGETPRAPGEIRYWAESWYPICDRSGQIQGVGVIVQDMTERQRASQKLAESEARFRTLFESAPFGLALVRGIIVLYTNPACARMFGYEIPAELTGASLLEGVAPEARAGILNRIERRQREGPEPMSFETLGLRQDGSTFPLQVDVTPTTLPDGPASVVFLADLTQRKRLEEQLVQTQKIESVGKLAGGIAHEFNNLLTGIMGYTELAGMVLDSEEEARGCLDHIQQAAQRAAELTRQLLAFARKQMIQPRILSLNLLLGRLETMLRRLIGEDIAFHTRLRPDLWPVKADPGQFEQIILNLVVNACDAMPDGGALTITTDNVTLEAEAAARLSGLSPGDYVTVTVTDTGIGFTAEAKAHLFEPFFTTKEVGKGRGMGLPTCYGLMRQHHGDMEVVSEPGRGAAFRLYLPRAAEAAPAEVKAVVRTLTPRMQDAVLVVEDEPLVRALAVSALRGAGYQVLEAPDGEEALQIARQHAGEVQLLLTDVVMPRLGGKDLAERLRREHPGLKVLFISGYSDYIAGASGEREPEAAFLAKPFTPSALVRRVRSLLEPAPR